MRSLPIEYAHLCQKQKIIKDCSGGGGGDSTGPTLINEFHSYSRAVLFRLSSIVSTYRLKNKVNRNWSNDERFLFVIPFYSDFNERKFSFSCFFFFLNKNIFLLLNWGKTVSCLHIIKKIIIFLFLRVLCFGNEEFCIFRQLDVAVVTIEVCIVSHIPNET